MNVSPAIATRGKLSSRLPNSIQVFSVVWPVACAATALLWVHLGQSGQPRPDEDRRTAAPVEMITALAITDARAHPRSDRSVGCHTRAISRESTRPMLTPRPVAWSYPSGGAAAVASVTPFIPSGGINVDGSGGRRGLGGKADARAASRAVDH